MDIDGFKRHIQGAVPVFSAIPKDKTIRIISHFDCDGVCAASILIKALNRDNRKYSITVLTQLEEKSLRVLSNEDYEYYVFADLGSGHESKIKALFSGKKFFIFDHHELEPSSEKSFYHINPHFFGIDGSKEISGAGVVYMFAKEFNSENIDSAHLAVIGAVGDVQESNGFKKLNNEILEDAVGKNLLYVKKELNLYGCQTRPIHKSLEYSTNVFIPGVSGSECGAIKLLNDVGINPKKGSGWRTLADLDDDDKRKLASAILLRRLDEENAEDIFAFSYFLSNEKKGTPFYSVKEFSTLLNACGRMNKASVGIGACLDSNKMKQKAMLTQKEYKREIMKAMNWYEDNKKNKGVVINKERYMILNAKNNIMPSIVGTMASMIAKSGSVEEGKYIMSLARPDLNTTKISLRIAGLREQKNIDLREIVNTITRKVGGESGGHMHAAGAIIPSAIEDKFISCAVDVLEKKSMEERMF